MSLALSPHSCPQLSRIMHESWQEYNILKVYIFIGLMFGVLDSGQQKRSSGGE